MSDESGSSLTRMLSILDRFTGERSEWTVDDLSVATGYTSSSCYRYVRALGRAGLLARLPGGTYVIGAKIIELETLTRRADPVARIAQPVLHELVQQTGCACLLSSVYGDHLINIAQEPGIDRLQIAYGRGEPLPWFRGSPGAAVLAFMPNARVRKLFDKFYAADVGEVGDVEEAWRDCRSRLKSIRQTGYCVSRGELQSDAVGFGVPVIPVDEPIGSISLVCTRQRADLLDTQAIGEMLVGKAKHIGTKIALHRAG
jgi:DNA-binding IclR family transcriptional regulator